MTTRFSVDPSETVPSFDIRKELIHREIFQDLLQRTKAGETLEFPKIAEAFPQLRQYRSYVLDLVYEDFCQRSAVGEVRRTDDYTRTFPEYSQQIKELIEVHRFFHTSGQVPDWLSDPKIWPMPEEEFLDYRICTELGRGAIGRVYLAKELSLGGRYVALKVSPYGHNEAKLLAKLNHPHVVPIYSVREDKDVGLTAVCMPYQGRTTLADLLGVIQDSPPAAMSARFWQEHARREMATDNEKIAVPASLLKKPFIDTALELVTQLASALEYVHERNILHRDLKPSNILITPERTAMILDFNLSTDHSEVENRIGGTLPYMSPEQIQQVLISPNAVLPLDERTDLYSMGVIFYELLSGRLPFDAKSYGVVSKQEASEFINKIQAGAEPLRNLVPEIDDHTARLIHECLDSDINKRPHSAKVLLKRLEQCRSLNARGRRTLLRHPRRTLLLAGLASTCLLIVGLFFLLRPSLEARLLALGWNRIADGQYGEAIVNFREVIANNPSSAETLRGIGRAYQLSGELQAALDAWKKSFQLEQDPKLAICIGYLECRQRDYNSALIWFEFAKSSQRNSAEYLNNYAHICRLMGTKTHAEAFELFASALEINPNLRQSLSGRATLAVTTDGNARRPIRTEALQDIDRAVVLPNPYPELFALAAKCHLAAKDNASHYDIAKAFAIRALDKGFGFKELENVLFQQSLLQDPELAKYRNKPASLERIHQEMNWVDPWAGLFDLRQ